MGGSISTQSPCKHWVFDVLRPRKPLQITMAGTDLTIFQKKHYIFQKVHRFCEKSASWWKNRIRIAAPHLQEVFWAWVGQFQHKVHANIEFLTSCGLTKTETVSHRTSIFRTVRKSIRFSKMLHRLYKTNVPLSIIFKPHSSASFWYVCLGMVGSSSTPNIYKHDVFAVLRPHAKV